jgi:hypothetical protein
MLMNSGYITEISREGSPNGIYVNERSFAYDADGF